MEVSYAVQGLAATWVSYRHSVSCTTALQAPRALFKVFRATHDGMVPVQWLLKDEYLGGNNQPNQVKDRCMEYGEDGTSLNILLSLDYNISNLQRRQSAIIEQNVCRARPGGYLLDQE